MIKRISIKNFRSLRNVTLEPGLINVFVGPNASGKSNAIDAFKFLTNMAMSGLSRTFSDRGGFGEVFWKGESAESAIDFELSLDLPLAEGETPVPVDYQLSIEGSRTDLMTVKRESLRITLDQGPVEIIDMTAGHGNIRNADGTKAFDSPGNPAVSMLDFNVPNWPGTIFKQYLARWSYYNLIPLVMKPIKPFTRANFLQERGDNLVEYLTTLKTSYADNFRSIEQVVKDTFPEVEQLIPEPTQSGQVFLTLREKYLKKPIKSWDMAEGELNFIAMVALILSPAEMGAPLVCVEEPESHLHPRLIETLVELLRQSEARFISQGIGAAQLFITTHSPYLVDQLKLDELVVVEKVRGETHYARPRDRSELRNLISNEQRGLGELWFSGSLGGV
jgi:predicted ATPase